MQPTALVFLSLNVLRLLSVIVTLLVFCAAIDLMVIDGNVAASLTQEEREQLLADDCEYIPSSDIPLHRWGLFWSQSNRVFLLVLCLLAVFSEISWGGLCDKFYRYCLPILGPDFGTVPLGLVQMMIAASLLSHSVWAFPLVVSWMLFIIGVLNVIAGASFRARGKDLRSIRASRRARARDREVRWPGDLKSPRGPQAAIAKAKAKASTASQALRKLRPSSSPPEAAPAAAATRTPSVSTRSHRTAPSVHDDFPALETAAHRELLRRQAREANERLEREAEEHEDLEAGAPLLGSQYVWDPRSDFPVARASSTRSRSLSEERLISAVARARGETGEGGPARSTSERRPGQIPVGGAGRRPVVARSAASAAASFKRRSLVLSKALKDLRRASRAAPSVGSTGIRRKQPPSPKWEMVEGSAHKHRSRDTEMIEVGPPPLPAYQPRGNRVQEAEGVGEGEASGAQRTSKLPVAGRFASEWGQPF